MNTRINNRIYRYFTYILIAASISLLAACGGGDSGPAAANPTGYYTGTADVVDCAAQPVNITDLQGLVDGNRFMAMSEAQELLYDGTITSISGNSFSATVKVYKDGALVAGSSTSFTGTITQSDKIIGTFGAGTWSGEFTLGYEEITNVASWDTVKSEVGEYWGGSDLTYASTDPQFQLDANGLVISPSLVGGGVMGGCEFNGDAIVPVANTRLYRLTVVVGLCGNLNGTYIGLATTKGSNNNTLVMAIALGDYANASDYIRRTDLP